MFAPRIYLVGTHWCHSEFENKIAMYLSPAAKRTIWLQDTRVRKRRQQVLLTFQQLSSEGQVSMCRLKMTDSQISPVPWPEA